MIPVLRGLQETHRSGETGSSLSGCGYLDFQLHWSLASVQVVNCLGFASLMTFCAFSLEPPMSSARRWLSI